MDNIFHRSVIKYLEKTGLGPKDIHAVFVIILGYQAPSLSTVQNMTAEFKRRKSFENDPKSRRSLTVITKEIIDRVHHMVMYNRRLTISQINNFITITHERFSDILHNELGLTKVSAWWVPRLLVPNQKRTRLSMSRENLT